MHCDGLHVIRVSSDQVVLKRGIVELLLNGPDVASLLERVVELIRQGRTRDRIVAAFPGTLGPEIDRLLTDMIQRRLVTTTADMLAPESSGGELQAAFWWNFGPAGVNAVSRLRNASVLVVGATVIARSLIQSLLELNVGRVRLVSHPALDDRLAPIESVALPLSWEPRVERVASLPPEEELREISLICATSDFGQADALLEMNRLALRTGRPYLPAWLANLLGYVGPLNYPHETACLRCYRARTDSNTPDHAALRAAARYVTDQPDARGSVGFAPPMSAIIGNIMAMEVAKCLGAFAPTDTAGRVIEINLVSFASVVRRVLKLPRCPDCSEVMRQGSKTMLVGAQIPNSEAER